MNTRSLPFRLVVWYALWLGVVFTMASALVYFGLRRYLEHSLAAEQTQRAHRIAALALQSTLTNTHSLAEDITARFAPEASERFIRVVRSDETVLYQSLAPHDLSFDPSQISAPSRRIGIRKERLPNGPELIFATVAAGPANAPKLFVETGASLAPALDELGRLLTLLGLSFLVVTGVALAGGYMLIRRALLSVEAITRSAERITSRNLNERLPIALTGDELEQLSVALNHMITRLDEAFQYSRRFVADASHELRTPLTVVKGELEEIAQNRRLTGDLRDRLGSVLEEVARLAQIVEGLFALSRLDAGEAQREWVRFDLTKLAATTVAQMNLLAEDKGISLECTESSAVNVEGDRARLKQIVVNLLDNSIKYTPEGGAITLRVTAQANEALLEVADTGIGIPMEALPHVFERFFRVDKARSRELGGAGLGLSIVKSICSAHGGRVDVESVVGRGSRVRVFFPSRTKLKTKTDPMESDIVQPAASQSPHPRKRWPVYLGSAFVIVGGILWFIMHAVSGHAQANVTGPTDATVAVAIIERSDLARELTVQAEFRPMQEVELHAKVAGFLAKILVDVGDRVEAGQLIAELEIPELNADLGHARASVSRSDAEVKRAEAAYQDAHLSSTRLMEVNQQQPNLLAIQDLDAARSKDLVAAASLAAAQEQVKASYSEVEKCESLVKYRLISAPFAGVVTKRFADPGALIQAGTSSGSQPLVRLSDLHELRLVFPVSVSYVSGIRENDPVRIEIGSLSRTFTGTITRFTHKVDTATRTMEVEVEVLNPDFKIIPGVYASVTLALEKRNRALVLPVQAVSRTRGNSILVVTASNELEERTVKLGLTTPDKIEVIEGVKEGELVVIGSRSQLRPGQKVTPKIVVVALTP